MRVGRKLDVGIGIILLILPLLWFAPQILGGKTLLPVDNLFTSEPWAGYASQFGAEIPHNPLISDLILENYAWKSLLKEAISAGELPLWNPALFAGVPFLAAGQHSGLYPFSILFYVLPLWQAYGVFTALQLGLAAAGMYLFCRVLGQRRPAAALAAIAFAFSGFFIASVNFSMIVAAAAWLPWILAVIELVVRRQAEEGTTPYAAVPYVVAGALLIGLQILAGHVEITYYVLMVSAFYAIWHFIRLARKSGGWRAVGRLATWLMAMAGLGLGLGAIQLMPLFELVKESFRQGSASLKQVLDWAWPSRQIITFLLPDAFGNPTHHSYFNIWTRAWQPVEQNALGQPLHTIDWGIKNYVEGANYLGLLTLLLATLAVLTVLWQHLPTRKRGSLSADHTAANAEERDDSRFHITGFGVLAVLSLLFAFGTPLYAVLFYLVPGYKQLHSAFRWVYPYSLSMAVLAGFGMNLLLAGNLRPAVRRIAAALGKLALVAGVAALAVVAASVLVPEPFQALGERLIETSIQARERAFQNGAMAWSYEATGLLRFGVTALLCGATLVWAARRAARPAEVLSQAVTEPAPYPGMPRAKPANPSSASLGIVARMPGGEAGTLKLPVWAIAMLALLIADLWLFGHDFNPATDPALLDFKPPVVEWLESKVDDSQPWRLTSFENPGEKLLNPNVGMFYGLEDIRGYDSIIPRQYVGYMERIQPQTDLLYNRIAPLYSSVNGQPNSEVLDDPLLDLLGVRYVVSTQPIPNAGYEQVYDGEVKVYENTEALPRVFIVPEAVPAPSQETALDVLRTVDPRHTVVVEGIGVSSVPPASSPKIREARISQRGQREVFVDVNIDDRGWLVFTDNYFDGWKAYVRPFGSQGEGVTAEGEPSEEQLPLYRADGTFRAVYLDQPGQWTVRFVYSPRSLQLGIYTAFLAAVTLMLMTGVWGWGRFYRGERSEVGTVAKNSVVQLALSLVNKGIDFAFAMMRLRILSPSGEGGYAFAITFYTFFEILTRFGLGTLLTRDVATDRSNANRYLTNVVVLRMGLWLVSLPIMFAVAMGYHLSGSLSGEEAQAIALFVAALLFANIADAVSSVFNAFEKMEYPAGVATAVAVAKVGLGAFVLLPPLDLGFVGLAGVSLVMNVVQAVWLYALLRRNLLAAEPPRSHIDWHLQWHMLRTSGPLMVNNLLASIFWRIDLWVLKAVVGASAVGIFSAGVKYLDGLNVIPAYFTLAIFPLMSRYAQSGTDSLLKAYRLAVQLLFIVSLPIAIVVSFGATPLIQILGGSAYLPDSAIGLSIMIWSIPIGFINSVTQYVLIAVNQQRFLTKAFLVTVAFTALANLLLVPRYGYVAAAAILIPAELSLFIPFAWAVRRYLAPVSWAGLCGRPLAAAALDALAVWMLQRAGQSTYLALLVGGVVYLATLLVLGTFRSDDFAVLRSRFAPNRSRGAAQS